MKPVINIRSSQVKDIPAILEIEQSAHLSPWSEKLLNSSFSNRSHNFVAETTEQIVGYVFSSLVADELTLENICVAPSKQGQGIGRLLMQYLLEQAKSLQVQDVWLEVRASNIAAIELYKQFGFIEQGVRKNYYPIPSSHEKEDAILMSHKL